MKGLHILVLTDHSGHSRENSLYGLLPALRQHPDVAEVMVASREIEENQAFFAFEEEQFVWAAPVSTDFSYSLSGDAFRTGLTRVPIHRFQAVWLRLPPPLKADTIHFFTTIFKDQIVVNRPSGILESGSKAFLMQFPEICPPMRLIQNKSELLAMVQEMPTVLKPFREYGGRGIVRIDGEQVWQGKSQMHLDDFLNSLPGDDLEYLGVKFLKNVSKGDKRIVVVNGEIMGASLRLPAKGEWLCNVAMGGSSNLTEVEEEEYEMVKRVNPSLLKLGIVMYGLDTLVNDEGKRVLSEINTTSIGGIAQIAAMRQLPLLERTIENICTYILQQIKLKREERD